MLRSVDSLAPHSLQPICLAVQVHLASKVNKNRSSLLLEKQSYRIYINGIEV
jgi:hypothetical protein